MNLVAEIATPEYCELRCRELLVEASQLREEGKSEEYHRVMNQVVQLVTLARLKV